MKNLTNFSFKKKQKKLIPIYIYILNKMVHKLVHYELLEHAHTTSSVKRAGDWKLERYWRRSE